MKANRKFIDGEEAVSAVIGVILMVAITVAIAATVYVYVSGMIGGGPATAFPNIILKDCDLPTTTAGTADELFTLEHRAGDTIDWSNYKVTVKIGATDHTEDLTYEGNADYPTGAFSVTDECKVVEDGVAVVGDTGATISVQIVDKVQQSIVYENTVFVE